MNNQKSYADLLRVEGVNAKGYGIVPKIVMKDERLTPYAKLIYSYFCSYCGAGNQAFPRRDTIVRDLRINKDTFYKHFNLLKKHDYIRVVQKQSKVSFCTTYIRLSNARTMTTLPKTAQQSQCHRVRNLRTR